MRADAFGNAAKTACLPAGMLDGMRGDRVTGDIAWEEPDLRAHRIPVFAQDYQQLGRQHDVAVLAPLALHHADDHPPAINGAGFQTDGFGDAQAGSVAGGQDRSMFQAFDAAEKTQNLLAAE